MNCILLGVISKHSEWTFCVWFWFECIGHSAKCNFNCSIDKIETNFWEHDCESNRQFKGISIWDCSHVYHTVRNVAVLCFTWDVEPRNATKKRMSKDYLFPRSTVNEIELCRAASLYAIISQFSKNFNLEKIRYSMLPLCSQFGWWNPKLRRYNVFRTSLRVWKPF